VEVVDSIMDAQAGDAATWDVVVVFLLAVVEGEVQ
jgi:hypothetical protein